MSLDRKTYLCLDCHWLGIGVPDGAASGLCGYIKPSAAAAQSVVSLSDLSERIRRAIKLADEACIGRNSCTNQYYGSLDHIIYRVGASILFQISN
jgi:hypothetical protein